MQVKSNTQMYLYLKNETPIPPSDLHVSHEISSVKEELRILHQKIEQLSPNYQFSISDIPTAQNPQRNETSLMITAWNCRGLSTAIPYITHLIETGSDIIALSEHWLWPYNINNLSSIYYTSQL